MGADPAADEQFGPYLVYERLGVGGMATVHRALERGIEGFERIVALKRLLPHLAEDATFIKAFVREAKLASLLHHINVVQIYELGRVGTEYFISMEYIDGRDIRRILRHARKVTGPPPLHVTVGLLTQLCDALDYAHHKTDEDGHPLGLVHRDVSPSNLLVTSQGHLKVIDFGIAKAQSSQLRTQTGRVKGKLAYMAPEAIAGRELDARSDLFAAGVIAHELLTARPLFASKNEYQTLLKVQRGDILPPSTFNQACMPEMDAIVMKALARDPDDRYASAAALREDLAALRRKQKLNCSFRDVAQWIEWAFTLEPPSGFAVNATIDQTGSAFRLTPPHSAHKTPTPRPRQQSEEEAAVEIAWGGGEGEAEQGPIVIDDVPDVSEKHLGVMAASAFLDDDDDIPAHTPSHGALGSDPDVNVAAITPASTGRMRPMTRSGQHELPSEDTTGKRGAIREDTDRANGDDPPTGRRNIAPDRTDPSLPPLPASMLGEDDDDDVAPPPPPVQQPAVARAKTGSQPGILPRARPGSQPNPLAQTMLAPTAAPVAAPATPTRPTPVQTPRAKTASGLNDAAEGRRGSIDPQQRRSSAELSVSRASPPATHTLLGTSAMLKDQSGSHEIVRQTPPVERARSQTGSRLSMPMPLPATPVEVLRPATPPPVEVLPRTSGLAPMSYASQPPQDPPGVAYSRGPRTKPGMPAQSRPPALVAAAAEQRATAPRAHRNSHVAIGASIIERQRVGPRWWIPVLGLVLVGGGIGAFLLATRGSDDPVAKKGDDKPAVAAAPATGTIKFETEPGDAEIRIEGQVVHSGSPWSTEIAAGKHQIEIHQSGFKSWLTTVDLSTGETQTFRVVLEPLGSTSSGDATLSLATPGGYDAFLDGKPVKTPLKMPLKVGAHALSIRKNGVEVWHQELRAQASAVYEFNPTFSDKRPVPRPDHASTAAHAETHGAEPTTPVASDEPTPPAPAQAEPILEPHTDPPPESVAPPLSDKPVVDKPTPPPPVPAPPTPAPPTGPVSVRPSDVTRTSGSPPNIAKGRYDDELPASIAVKLCIDTGGHVSSATMLTKNVSHAVGDEIVDTLRGWVYAPYKKNGVATPACFVVNLRTKS